MKIARLALILFAFAVTGLFAEPRTPRVPVSHLKGGSGIAHTRPRRYTEADWWWFYCYSERFSSRILFTSPTCAHDPPSTRLINASSDTPPNPEKPQMRRRAVSTK